MHSLLFVKMINYCWTFTHDRPTNLGFSLIVVISVPRLLVMLLVPADEIIVGDLYRYLPSLLIIHNRIFHPWSNLNVNSTFDKNILSGCPCSYQINVRHISSGRGNGGVRKMKWIFHIIYKHCIRTIYCCMRVVWISYKSSTSKNLRSIWWWLSYS